MFGDESSDHFSSFLGIVSHSASLWPRLWHVIHTDLQGGYSLSEATHISVEYCWFGGIKGAVSRYSEIFCAFLARVKNGDCSRKCRGDQTMTARSAARTASPPKLSRENVVFLVFCGLALWPPLFSPHKMAAKNHQLSWHCRFKTPLRSEISSDKRMQSRSDYHQWQDI